MKRPYILFVALLCMTIPIHAQLSDLKFQHLDVKDGLSQNTVTHIVQDKYGFIWFGTFNGLNRYDGYTFKIYKTELDNMTSLSTSRITKLFIDSTGVLWVIETDNIYNRYNFETDDFTRFSLEETPEGIINNYSREEAGGRSLIYKNHKFEFKPLIERIFHYTDLNTGIEILPTINKDDQYGLKDLYIRDIFIDDFQVFWVGTFSNGIAKADLNRKNFVHYRKSNDFDHGLIDNNIRAICQDKNGVLWIGTRSKGIAKFDRNKNTYKHYQAIPGSDNSLVSNEIRDIFIDRSGNIWIGTKGGVDKFDPKTERFHSILKGTGSSYWVFMTMQDKLRNIWFATFGGLYKYNEANNDIIKYTTEDSVINDLDLRFVFEDSKGFIWVGSESGGVTRLERTGDPSVFQEKFKSYHYLNNSPGKKRISDTRIYSICEDENGTIWLGTGNGLNKYNREDDTFDYYTSKDGLADDMIPGVLSDRKGNIWFSHKRGISKININNYAVKNYSVLDGLQGIEFNEDAYFFNSQTGEMFFGGTNGFNSFFPDSIKDNPIAPKVYFTNIEVNDKYLNIGEEVNGRIILEKNIILTDEIVLTHHEKRFAIEFTALHYANPEKNSYKYMLEGFDNRWISVDANDRKAVYSNLNADTYKFKVKAANSDGIWNETPAVLTIKVLPPWWKTWWFRILLISSILGAVIAIYKTQTRNMKRRNEQLEAEVKTRTKEVIKQKDDIEQAYNRMSRAVNTINESTQKMTALSDTVADTSTEFSDTSQRLAAASSEHASSISEMSTSLQELFTSASANATNSQDANMISTQLQSIMSKSLEDMNTLSTVIKRIHHATNETETVIHTIEEISTMIQMLSVNAAIEAMRAGEYGKGFQAVAKEFQELAEQSEAAVYNTKSLIHNAIEHVEKGTQLNKDVVKRFKSVGAYVERITLLMTDISTASVQQKLGIDQINTGVDQLNQVMKINTEAANHSVERSEQLSMNAEELRSLVNSLTEAMQHLMSNPE